MKPINVLLAALVLGLVFAQDTGGTTGGEVTGGEIGGSLVGEGGMTGGDLEAAETITGGAAADNMTGGMTGGMSGGMTGGATVDELAGGADDVTGGALSDADATSMVGPNGDMSGGDVTGGDIGDVVVGSTTGGDASGGVTGGDMTGGATSFTPNDPMPNDLGELASSHSDLGALIARLESDTAEGTMNVDDATLEALRRIHGDLGGMLEQVRGASGN